MPLKKGKSQETVGKNIKELEHSYKKTGKIGTSKPKSKKAAHKQAIAIALNKAGKSKLKESYDDVVNNYLKKYLIEMDVRQTPEEVEGIVNYPYEEVAADKNAEQEDHEFNEWLKQKFKDRPGFLRNLAYDQDMLADLFYDFKQERVQTQSGEEDYEEECESAKEGCKCNNCPECQSNQKQGSQMLSFYFPDK